MKKELKRGQLTLKDMSVLREGAAPRDQVRINRAALRDYSLNHIIHMGWGYPDPDRDLRPFTLSIDRRPYTLSWGELKDMDHAGFFRREDRKSYTLKYFDGNKITIDVDLNDEAERDMMFRLTTDDGKELIMDWYETLRAGRFI